MSSVSPGPSLPSDGWRWQHRRRAILNLNCGKKGGSKTSPCTSTFCSHSVLSKPKRKANFSPFYFLTPISKAQSKNKSHNNTATLQRSGGNISCLSLETAEGLSEGQYVVGRPVKAVTKDCHNPLRPPFILLNCLTALNNQTASLLDLRCCGKTLQLFFSKTGLHQV